MNFNKQQKDIALVVLASIFLIGIAAYAYLGIYAPAREAKLQTEQMLASEREVLMALQTQQKELPEGEKINPGELQQKVSVEPLTDLIVLQIEQAELISQTLVKTIGFAEGPLELLNPLEGVENIQEVLTTVEIEAEDYESITAFIKEIEAMKRIMVVDSIEFSSYPETTQQVQENEPLSVSLQFSAFYRPDLIALADTQPKVAAPPPAKKVNPMPRNDGTNLAVSEEAAVGTNDSEDAKTGSESEDVVVSASTGNTNPNVAGTQTAKYHKVEEGDTLSMISLKYYNSLDGEESIKQANNMTDQALMPGTTLIIPERP